MLERAESSLPSGETAWLVTAGTWLFMLLVNTSVGWPQTKETRGSIWRLLWTSAGLAVIAVLPVVVVAVFASCGAVRLDQLKIAALCTFLNMITTRGFLSAPGRIGATGEQLPLVTEESFLASVSEIAAKMHIPAPIVRMWPSISESQNTLAYVGTLQAPQVLVTDGILRRLTPEERDAVVAHEMAHVANGSMWMLAAVFPVSGAVTTAVMGLLPVIVALSFGMAFLVGLRRIVSRPVELDCDYRAACATSFRATSSALAKIHAVHPISHSTLLSMLLYATATHPSRTVRLVALSRRAPPVDRPDHAIDGALVRKSERVAMGALVIWGLALSLTLIAAAAERADAWMALPLLTITVTPLGLMILGGRKQAVRMRRRMGVRWGILAYAKAILAFVCLIAFCMAAVVVGTKWSGTTSTDPAAVIVIVVGGILLVASPQFWITSKRRILQHAVAAALQLHEFQRVVELCRASQKIVDRNHQLRYCLAVAEAACGNRTAAIEMLEKLWIDKPLFPLIALCLAELLLDAGNPERALEIVQSVKRQLPPDPIVPLLEAWAFRRMGRTREAVAAYDYGLAWDPEDGSLQAFAALLKLDRSDLEGARLLIKVAAEFSPGHAHVLIARAEILIQGDNAEQARQAVDEAVQSIQTNPLVFLKSEIPRLHEMFTRRFSQTG